MMNEEDFSKLLADVSDFIRKRQEEDFCETHKYVRCIDYGYGYEAKAPSAKNKETSGAQGAGSYVSSRTIKDVKKFVDEKEKQSKTFRDKLFEYMNQKNMSDKDIYSAVGMDVKDFNKIKNNVDDKSIPIDKAILIAYGLKLSFEEMEEFIGLAGRKLRKAKRSYVIEYFFRKNDYDIDKLNSVLYELNQKPLITVKGDDQLLDIKIKK